MNRQSKSDWWIPGEAMGLWFTALLPLAIGLLTSLLLPVVDLLRNVELDVLYICAVTAGCIGVSLLFIARLPLYRVGKFLAFGPGLFDQKHRRIYRTAYCFLLMSALLFLAVGARA